MGHDDVRRLALALPEATELDHHGMPSFRVRGRIFATLPGADHVNVFVEGHDLHGAVAAEAGCEELWWGRRLRGVRVDLRVASAALLGDLLAAAWTRRAPRSLLPLATRRPDPGDEHAAHG